MLRTKASTYAILAVAEIANRQGAGDAGVQAAEVAASLKLPAAYAAKVLTELARAGVLRSDRGPRGGFRLLRPPAAVSLLEIVEVVDGAITADVGLAENPAGAGTAVRSVEKIFDGIAAQVRATLRDATISGVMGRKQPVPPVPQPS